ncbi:MAG: hypothetical protein R2848_03660 [Thermomicrobiales bacterium]
MIIAFCVFIVGFLILRYTRLGLYVYAIGGNETATCFSAELQIDWIQDRWSDITRRSCASFVAIMLTASNSLRPLI